MRRLRTAFVVVVVALATLTTACRDDHVDLTFRPRAGASFRYAVHVESTSVTDIPGRPPSNPRDVADLTADQHVLDVTGGVTRLQVRVDRPNVGARTFVMHFDRAAQLTDVESVEGIPAEALGQLGLSEIFPAAAGAPPDRRLQPGDRWTVDDQVQLAGMPEPARLTGEGRLVELGVVDGHRTATVTSTTTLPVTARSTAGGSAQTLTGVEATTITVVYDLDDGTVRRSSAQTSATFDVVLAAPAGQPSAPLHGTVRVEVHSDIRRTA